MRSLILFLLLKIVYGEVFLFVAKVGKYFDRASQEGTSSKIPSALRTKQLNWHALRLIARIAHLLRLP